MKKTLAAGAAILMILMFAVLIWPKERHNKTILRCDGEITTRLGANTEDANAAVLQTKVYFFLYHAGKGFIRLNGSVGSHGKFYILNRELWYSYNIADDAARDDDDDTDANNNGVHTLRFTADLKHSGDSVPADIWEKFLHTEDAQVSYHITIKKVTENIYLISTLSGPAFMCHSY